mmetsp:Transcript_27411/g.89726  ORF Transcript_27411/g.89726 Transcript_27411/m.89726 type:complete len:109 (+) Transcript_27411:162-488(+)
MRAAVRPVVRLSAPFSAGPRRAAGVAAGELRGGAAQRRRSRGGALVRRDTSLAAALVRENVPDEAPPDAYEALKGKTVYRATDGESLDVTSLWSEDERCVVAFMRSFG